MSYLRSSIYTALNKPIVLQPTAIMHYALALSLFGSLSIIGSNTYAAPTDKNTLKVSAISLSSEYDDSDSDADDDVDSAPDNSALDDSDDFGSDNSDDDLEYPMDDSDDLDSDIPEEVSRVSLNAISPDTLKTFVKVVGLVRREYINAVNDEALFNNAISGMLTKLDSHAEFLDAEAYDNLRAFTQGDVGDIGITVMYQPQAGYWVVTDVISDSPADENDIDVGDYLHQIDDFELDENNRSNDVKQLLSGIAGTQVDVVTSRAGRRKHTTTLQRNNSNPKAIETRLVDGIAIIKLPVFQNNSREKIIEGVVGLDAPVSGILLDVRDNPGGVLSSAINIASLFMTDTDVVQVKSRNADPRTLSTKGVAILKPLPVVILQNRYSASAAEVLASSLQAQNRALIVGEISYGKGSVQSVIPLDNEQAIKLTVAHYLTANGGEIDAIGVKPDVMLLDKEKTWEAQALSILREQIQTDGIRFINKKEQKTQGQ
ncbi:MULTISPECIES: S41 family peptidase [unclassified Psychrobacter]|uniref:S41 family peptidase n=1 Tax=unclassified Psychrobacter TaxID=196806 RepID=UPI003FD13DA9